MEKTDQEPECRDWFKHSYFKLGTEDNGEIVSRCGNCMTLKYEAPGGAVRYEVPV